MSQVGPGLHPRTNSTEALQHEPPLDLKPHAVWRDQWPEGLRWCQEVVVVVVVFSLCAC